jgi:signal transduction histidine kinase
MVEPQKCFTEEYVAQVVHDLKTPVLAIGGYAKRLREGKLGPLNERQKEALDAILETAGRLDHDLGWIVEHARAGRFVWEEARHERFDLRDHVDRVVETIRVLAQQEGIALDLELPEDPVEVSADPRMMERSVSELVHNALKHSEEGGRVEVSLEVKEGSAELAVSDRGAGFDPEKLKQIFQPWEQVIRIEDRQIRGVGLGLANVKHYAEAQGGTVRAETSPGEGSTFRLVLPLEGGSNGFPPGDPERSEA